MKPELFVKWLETLSNLDLTDIMYCVKYGSLLPGFHTEHYIISEAYVSTHVFFILFFLFPFSILIDFYSDLSDFEAEGRPVLIVLGAALKI